MTVVIGVFVLLVALCLFARFGLHVGDPPVGSEPESEPTEPDDRPGGAGA